MPQDPVTFAVTLAGCSPWSWAQPVWVLNWAPRGRRSRVRALSTPSAQLCSRRQGLVRASLHPLGARMAAAPCWVPNSSCPFSEISQSGLSWPLQRLGKKVSEDPGEFPLGLSFFRNFLKPSLLFFSTVPGCSPDWSILRRRSSCVHVTGQTLGFILPLGTHWRQAPTRPRVWRLAQGFGKTHA